MSEPIVSKWWRRAETADPAPDDGNVVHMPKPKLDVLEAAIKQEQQAMREIIKEGAALEERHNECVQRLTNARAAMVERMGQLGIKSESVEPANE